eukprot:5481693-Lingulodinium_polyedra.AAC.1
MLSRRRRSLVESFGGSLSGSHAARARAAAMQTSRASSSSWRIPAMSSSSGGCRLPPSSASTSAVSLPAMSR